MFCLFNVKSNFILNNVYTAHLYTHTSIDVEYSNALTFHSSQKYVNNLNNNYCLSCLYFSVIYLIKASAALHTQRIKIKSKMIVL